MRYLVESYLPPPSREVLERLEARATTAADDLTRADAPVRYIEVIVVPEDEMCLFVYEAGSAELAREASARAGISCERIVEASVSPGAHHEGTRKEIRNDEEGDRARAARDGGGHGMRRRRF